MIKFKTGQTGQTQTVPLKYSRKLNMLIQTFQSHQFSLDPKIGNHLHQLSEDQGLMDLNYQTTGTFKNQTTHYQMIQMKSVGLSLILILMIQTYIE